MTSLKVRKALSIAVLLAASSTVYAQGAHAPAAPVHAPAAPAAVVPAAAAAPEPAPVAEPAVVPTTPIAVSTPAIPEPAPAAKPAAPTISVAGTKISLYGFLQLNAVYEDGANGGLNWSNYVLKNAQDGEGRLLINVNQTRLGLNLAGPAKETGAEVSGKFESDFVAKQDRFPNGVGGFRIRHAYGQLKFNDIGLSLLFGQTQDIIAPLVAPSLNQGALQGDGSLGTRRPMIRAAQALGPVEIAAAVTDNRDAAAPVLPAFQGSVKAKVPASWAGEKQNVEFILSGHYASLENAADDSTGKEAKKADTYPKQTSWSGIASLSLPVISIVNLSGEFFYGQNLGNYNVGSIGQTGVLSKTGAGLQSTGGWGAANIKLPADFALAGGYGVESINKSREPKEGRVKNQVIFTNLRYFVDEAVFVGFEYANLLTRYADNADPDNRQTDKGKLNRYELVLNYSFK